MDTPALVHAFNNLPRRPKAPSGTVGNHWNFNIHNVPLQPPGDLLFLLNPASLYIHVEGPIQIANITSPSARADIILPLLLKSFVTGLQQGGLSGLAPFAPWSWSTKDEALARALEEKLRAVGVREELCSVSVADQTLNDLDQERWGEFLKGLTGMARRGGDSGAPAPTASSEASATDVCATCKKGPGPGIERLRACSGCKTVRYCSRDCQKANWKQHKRACKTTT